MLSTAEAAELVPYHSTSSDGLRILRYSSMVVSARLSGPRITVPPTAMVSHSTTAPGYLTRKPKKRRERSSLREL